ncbi:MAG: NADH-quinone oxidoreductase subunit NuoH [Paludibacteraceae bacterium]|nr:NADH-quinone oxidoreductase subunit NuoH [Paludibacteraceae bacterium]
MLQLSDIITWIHEFLSANIPAEWAVKLIEYVLVGLGFLTLYALIALFLIIFERKICAYFQCRLGPNRVGPWGIFQVIADMVKILLKEIIPLKHNDKLLYYAAPFIVIMGSLLTFGGLQFAKGVHGVDFNIGVFYLLAVSSISIIGVMLAGWSSNNKYSLIGAMRSGAQVISFELSACLSMMAMVILCGSMNLSDMMESQGRLWFIFQAPIPAFIGMVIYLIAAHAETNRGPFDLPEAESELTAGYHVEYSGITFGFFYVGEYCNLFINAAIGALVFLGGWQPLHFPGCEGFNAVMDYIPSCVWFFGKTLLLIFLSLWVRWSFPRLRIDQLLHLEWKIMLPFSLFNILLMAVLVANGWVF